jgi:tight adherence protein B
MVGTLAVIALFMAIYSVTERSDDIAGRLAAYASGAREQAGPGERRRSGLAPLLSQLDRLLSGQAMAQRLALMLAQANIRTTLPEFLLVEAAAAVIGGLVGLLWQGYAISCLAGALVGLAVPYLVVLNKRNKRLKAFQDQLVDVLSLTVGSLRGGHALPTALDLISKELSPPASEEFGRVLRETGYGLSQAEALNNLVVRMESPDLQLVVTAINITHEVGGNLSLVLEAIAETIRERIRLHGEIRVLTTQQRMTSYLLALLPIGLGVVLALVNPGWVMRMFEPGWVRIIPIAALVSEAIGFVITQKLTRIEV